MYMTPCFHPISTSTCGGSAKEAIWLLSAELFFLLNSTQLKEFGPKQVTAGDSLITFAKLRQTIHPALNSISVDLIRNFSRKARDYERAYKDGHKAGYQQSIDRYKSHRRNFHQ